MALQPVSAVDLTIIIISYNTRMVTLECLDSLFRFPPAVPYEVIVLDNASGDGSADAIAERYLAADLIRSPVNLGFAGGNNEAAKRAVGRRILLLNPDTVVLQNSFAGLWNFAEREPHHQIWGGRTLFEDGSLNPTSCWRQITLWSVFCSAIGLSALFPKSALFTPESFGSWQRNTQRDVDIVTGCFLMIDRDLWLTLDGFDRTFFMYAEEADLCLRARKQGARPAITPDAELIHLGGRSESSRLEKIIKIMRGRITLMRKHWSTPRFRIGQALYLLWSGLRVVGATLFARPQEDATSAREKWTEIWRRRNEWLGGYPEIGAPASTDRKGC